jgi:hypothetical protein
MVFVEIRGTRSCFKVISVLSSQFVFARPPIFWFSSAILPIFWLFWVWAGFGVQPQGSEAKKHTHTTN